MRSEKRMLKCKCGDTLEDWRGARGHVQFNGDDTHGDKMEMPDEWKGLFTEVDSDADESDDDDEGEAGGSQADQSPTETEESDTDESDGSQGGGGLRKLLTTPIDDLLGGGE